MNFDAKTWYVVDYEFSDEFDINDRNDIVNIVDNIDDDSVGLPYWLTPKNAGIALLILIELGVLGALIAFAIDSFLL